MDKYYFIPGSGLKLIHFHLFISKFILKLCNDKVSKCDYKVNISELKI